MNHRSKEIAAGDSFLFRWNTTQKAQATSSPSIVQSDDAASINKGQGSPADAGQNNIRAADCEKTIPQLAGTPSDLVHGEGAIVINCNDP
ncbi:J domain-containing protein [Psidium guajava]|nr:J domain-containing protein [Psidium guajava]